MERRPSGRAGHPRTRWSSASRRPVRVTTGMSGTTGTLGRSTVGRNGSGNREIAHGAGAGGRGAGGVPARGAPTVDSLGRIEVAALAGAPVGTVMEPTGPACRRSRCSSPPGARAPGAPVSSAKPLTCAVSCPGTRRARDRRGIRWPGCRWRQAVRVAPLGTARRAARGRAGPAGPGGGQVDDVIVIGDGGRALIK